MAQPRDEEGKWVEDDGTLRLTDRPLSELTKMRDYFQKKASETPGTVRKWGRRRAQTASSIRQELRRVHLGRSQEAQNADDGQQATRTMNPITWLRNPDRYDFVGVDTKDS